MNLFVTDPLPGISAIDLDDRRVVKMVLETAQLLSTAVHLGMMEKKSDDDNGYVYRATHKHHPVTKWVVADPHHIGWTYLYFVAILNEFEIRFKKRHASKYIFYRLSPPDTSKCRPTEFCNCTPFPELPPFAAYRQTLRHKWHEDKFSPTWRVRGEPSWRYPTSPSAK